jgi:hypothetical protein
LRPAKNLSRKNHTGGGVPAQTERGCVAETSRSTNEHRDAGCFYRACPFHAQRHYVLVAQASGLLFPASRRKPFATAIIFPTTANPQAASPREIWRDAKFNRRDACSTPKHPGCCCVPAQTERGCVAETSRSTNEHRDAGCFYRACQFHAQRHSVFGGTGLRPVVSGVAPETVCDDDNFPNDRQPAGHISPRNLAGRQI